MVSSQTPLAVVVVGAAAVVLGGLAAIAMYRNSQDTPPRRGSINHAVNEHQTAGFSKSAKREGMRETVFKEHTEPNANSPTKYDRNSNAKPRSNSPVLQEGEKTDGTAEQLPWQVQTKYLAKIESVVAAGLKVCSNCQNKASAPGSKPTQPEEIFKQRKPDSQREDETKLTQRPEQRLSSSCTVKSAHLLYIEKVTSCAMAEKHATAFDGNKANNKLTKASRIKKNASKIEARYDVLRSQSEAKTQASTSHVGENCDMTDSPENLQTKDAADTNLVTSNCAQKYSQHQSTLSPQRLAIPTYEGQTPSFWADEVKSSISHPAVIIESRKNEEGEPACPPEKEHTELSAVTASATPIDCSRNLPQSISQGVVSNDLPWHKAANLSKETEVSITLEPVIITSAKADGFADTEVDICAIEHSGEKTKQDVSRDESNERKKKKKKKAHTQDKDDKVEAGDLGSDGTAESSTPLANIADVIKAKATAKNAKKKGNKPPSPAEIARREISTSSQQSRRRK